MYWKCLSMNASISVVAAASTIGLICHLPTLMPFCFIFFPHQGQWWQHLFHCYFSGAFRAVIVKGLSAFPLHTRTHACTHFLREGAAQITLWKKKICKNTSGAENGMGVLEASICIFYFVIWENKWRYKRFQVSRFAFINGKQWWKFYMDCCMDWPSRKQPCQK